MKRCVSRLIRSQALNTDAAPCSAYCTVAGQFVEPRAQKPHFASLHMQHASELHSRCFFGYVHRPLSVQGTLRSALNQRRLVDVSTPHMANQLPAVPLVLTLAHDVACAMLHLHKERIVHGDLKASNVLLSKGNTPCGHLGSVPATDGAPRCQMPVSEGICELLNTRENGVAGSGECRPESCAALMAAAQAASGGRLVAKVADFGLSSALDPGCSHISKIHSVGAVRVVVIGFKQRL